MPTLSRLLAAICLSLLAYGLSKLVMPLMPEGMDFGYFTEINMVIGLLVGWKVIGARSGRGYDAVLGVGISGALTLVFWAVFLYSCLEMFDRAQNNRFDNPSEALLFILEMGTEYLITIANPTIALTVLLGGAMSGLVAELACRDRYSKKVGSG